MLQPFYVIRCWACEAASEAFRLEQITDHVYVPTLVTGGTGPDECGHETRCGLPLEAHEPEKDHVTEVQNMREELMRLRGDLPPTAEEDVSARRKRDMEWIAALPRHPAHCICAECGYDL